MTQSQERDRAPADLSALRIRREPEKARGPRGWLLAAAILVVAAGAAAFLYSGKALRGKTVETVSASVVTEGQATTLLSATGYVEAERKADLSPKITSRITELNVTEGTRVRKGDVIARLDHTDLDANLADANASWINVTAQVEVILGTRNDVVVVPEKCVRTDPTGGAHVFVQQTGTPTRTQTVKLGTASKDRVEITDGVSAGQSLLCR